jgi:hypothetical protein
MIKTPHYSSLPKARIWRTTYLSGRMTQHEYQDSHCLLRSNSDKLLDLQWVVAPNGVKLDRRAYILLCTIPFYANHHEGVAKEQAA